jgi:hypothetical protein
MKSASEFSEPPHGLSVLLKSAEVRALPKANLWIYGLLIGCSSAFESGFTFLDLHRNLGAHAIFYILLFGLIREVLIRNSPKISAEEPEAPFIRTLKLEQRFCAFAGTLGAGALALNHHAVFVFPLLTYLIAFVFYIHAAHCSPRLKLIAFVQVLLATASIMVLSKAGGMEWLPIFTTLLAATFFGAALFR